MSELTADPRRRLAGRIMRGLPAGTAYGAALCWGGVCLVAVFRPEDLVHPYWLRLPALRTDTCGIVAAILLVPALALSRYLAPSPRPVGNRAVRSVAEAAAVVATGTVVYLSANAATHPWTLGTAATHVLDWPSESTLRVVALLVAAASVTIWRGWAGTHDEAGVRP